MSNWYEEVYKAKRKAEAEKQTKLQQEQFLTGASAFSPVPIPTNANKPEPVKPVYEKPQAPTTFSDVAGEAWQGVKRAPAQGMAQLADLVNIPIGSDFIAGMSGELNKQAYQNYPSSVQAPNSVQDLANMSSGDIIKYIAGESPQFLASILPFKAATSIAGKIVPRVIKAATKIPGANALLKNLGGAGKVSEALVAASGGIGMETGSIYGEGIRAKQENPDLPEPSRLKSLAWGIPSGLMEGLGMDRILSGMKPSLAMGAKKTFGRMAKDYGLKTAGDATTEFLTEYGQTLIEEMGAENLAGTGVMEAINKIASDPNAHIRGLAAGLSGMGGGGMSGAVTNLNSFKQEKATSDFADAPKVKSDTRQAIDKIISQSPKPTTPTDINPETVENDLGTSESIAIAEGLIKSTGFSPEQSAEFVQKIFDGKELSELGKPELEAFIDILTDIIGKQTPEPSVMDPSPIDPNLVGNAAQYAQGLGNSFEQAPKNRIMTAVRNIQSQLALPAPQVQAPAPVPQAPNEMMQAIQQAQAMAAQQANNVEQAYNQGSNPVVEPMAKQPNISQSAPIETSPVKIPTMGIQQPMSLMDKINEIKTQRDNVGQPQANIPQNVAPISQEAETGGMAMPYRKPASIIEPTMATSRTEMEIKQDIEKAQKAKNKKDKSLTSMVPPAIKSEVLGTMDNNLSDLETELENVQAKNDEIEKAENPAMQEYNGSTIYKQSEVGGGESFVAKTDGKYLFKNAKGDISLIGNQKNAHKFVSREAAQQAIDNSKTVEPTIQDQEKIVSQLEKDIAAGEKWESPDIPSVQDMRDRGILEEWEIKEEVDRRKDSLKKLKEDRKKHKAETEKLRAMAKEAEKAKPKQPKGKSSNTFQWAGNDVTISRNDDGSVTSVYLKNGVEKKRLFVSEEGYLSTTGKMWKGTPKQAQEVYKLVEQAEKADAEGQNYMKIVRPIHNKIQALIESFQQEQLDNLDKTDTKVEGQEVNSNEKTESIQGEAGKTEDALVGLSPSTTNEIDKGNEKGTGENAMSKDTAVSISSSADVGKAGNVNVVNLAKALVPEMEKLLTADKPMDNRQLKKLIKELGIDITDKDYNHKITQEAVEAAMVMVVRKNNLQGNSEALIKLYTNQPNLSVRTGASIAQQAYSTPIPLVGMVTDNIGTIEDGAVVYEPTAGNGLLLTGIKENENGTKMNYHLNELDKTRNDLLKSLFPDANITNEDAFDFSPDAKADVVFTNPPFGSMKSFSKEPLSIKPDGEISPTITFRKADHAIVYKALQSMKDDGRAVIVVGAHLIKGEPNKSVIDSGSKILYTYLYNQFNVTGHFEISGKLYNRQGAAWPVAIITLEGKKAFPKNYTNAPDSVERAVNWNEVKELTSKIKQGVFLTGKPRTGTTQGTEQSTDKTGSEQVADRGDNEGTRSEARTEDNLGDATTDAGRREDGQPTPDSTSNIGEAGDGGRNEFKPTPSETFKDRAEAQATAKPVIGRLNPDDNSGVTSEDTELQKKYNPVSKIDSIGALVPINLENPIKESLDGLEKEVGKSLEDYVAIKLGYKSSEDLIDKKSGRSILSGEQVDATALAISAIDNQDGVVVADQTGLGKGRVAAASIAYAVKAGKIPIFITEKAGLFNDIYRDLKNIKEEKLRPFIFNSDGSMTDKDTGQKVYKYNGADFDADNKNATFNKMKRGDYSDFGKNGKYDYIVTTYTQFNKEKAPKLDALLKAPEQSLVGVLDESHNGAGVSGGGQSNQGKNVSRLLAPEVTSGVIYLSATWAKRPEQMIIYHRAFGKGKATMDEINQAFERGGLAMQEMMVTSMARQRSYVRREQSFAGVKFLREKTDYSSPESKRENEMAEKTMELVSEITDLGGEANLHMSKMDISDLDVPDDFVGGDVDNKGNSVTASIDVPTSPFSQIHNYVSAFVTALKAKETAKKAVEAIKAGQKPVIVVKNTMESQLNILLDMGKAKMGDGFSGTFSDVLDLIQDKILSIPVSSNFDSKKKMTVYIPLEKFPPSFQAKFGALKNKINETKMGDMPFSTIDYLKSEISKAGLTAGELTGRKKYLDYSKMQDGSPTLSTRETKEYNQEGRRQVVSDFNNGDIDALILNQAGSTGISAHSSFEYKDQRQRVMFILQAFDDINTFMQMIGRIHRVGAVTKSSDVTSVIPDKPATYGFPEYKYLQSSLGMEIRTGIQLENKMKSLNAQTSSNEKGHQSVADVDVMNKYGQRVMQWWLMDNRKTREALGLNEDSHAGRITGRMAIRPQEEQNRFWEEVVTMYNELIASLDASGENDLVVPTMTDANAKTLAKKLVYGEEGSRELPPVYVEKVEITITGKPVSLEGARQRAEKGTGISEEDMAERNEQYEDTIKQWKQNVIDGKGKLDEARARAYKKEVEQLIKSLNVGDLVIERGDGKDKKTRRGIITKISFKKLPKSYLANPFALSMVQIEMATNNKTGKIRTSLHGYKKDEFSKQGTIENVPYQFKNAYEKEYQANLTRKTVTEVLTGDMIKAQSMASNTVAVQFGREDGTQDFGWMNDDYRQDNKTGSLQLTMPVEALTNQDIEHDTPNKATSMDGQSVVIRPATEEQKNYYTGTWDVTEVEGDPATKPFEIVVLSAKTAKFGRAIYSNKELIDLIKKGEQDAVFTETKLNKKKALKTGHIPMAKKADAMKLVNKILKASASGLVNADKRKIDTSNIGRVASTRQGSNALLNSFNNFVAEGFSQMLESAYKHVGSYLTWLNATIQKYGKEIRAKASEIWKFVKDLVKQLNPSMKGRRGGIMSLKSFVSAYEKEAKKQQQEVQQATVAGGNEKVAEFAGRLQEGAYNKGQEKAKSEAKKVTANRIQKKDEKISEAKKKLEQVKKEFKTKRDLGREARNDLMDMAEKLPPKVRVKAMKAINNATTPMTTGIAINRIDDLYNEYDKRQSMKDYLKALEKANINELRPEFRDDIKELKAQGDTKLALKILKDYRNSFDNVEGYLTPETQGYIDGLIANRQMPYVSAEAIKVMTVAIKAIAAASERENAFIFGSNLENIVEKSTQMQADLAKEKQAANDMGKAGFFKWFFDSAMMSLENIAEMFGDAGRKIFFDDLNAGERKSLDIWYSGKDKLANALKSMGLEPESVKLEEWASEEVDLVDAAGERIKIPRSVRMNILANLSDPTTKREILKGGIKQDRFKETIKINYATISMLEDSASAKEKKLIGVMKEFINGELKKEINSTWVALAGFEKALSDKYWPRKRETEPKGFNAGYRQWATSALEHMGIFKERTTSSKAVIIGDIFSTYQTHLKQASTFAGTAIPLRNVEMALGVGGMEKAIEKKLGVEMVDRIKSHMEAIGDLGNAPVGEVNKKAQALLQNVSVGFLGFNVRSSIKQAGGLFTAATEIAGSLLANNANKAFDKGVEERMMKYSSQLRNRYDGAGAKMVNPTFEDRDTILRVKGFKGKHERAVKTAMMMLEKGDKAVSQVIWGAVEEKFAGDKAKMSEDAFYNKVAREAEKIVMRTQNVTSKLGMSGLAIESRKNAFLKALVAFQSQGNAIYNIVRRAIRKYRRGEADLPELFNVLAMALMGNAMWSVLVSQVATIKWLKGNKEALTKGDVAVGLIKENVGNVYGGSMVSPFVRMIARSYQGKKVFGSNKMESVTQSVLNNVLSGSAQMATAPLKKEKLKTLGKGAYKMVMGLAPALSFPLMPLKEFEYLIQSKKD